MWRPTQNLCVTSGTVRCADETYHHTSRLIIILMDSPRHAVVFLKASCALWLQLLSDCCECSSCQLFSYRLCFCDFSFAHFFGYINRADCLRSNKTTLQLFIRYYYVTMKKNDRYCVSMCTLIIIKGKQNTMGSEWAYVAPQKNFFPFFIPFFTSDNI